MASRKTGPFRARASLLALLALLSVSTLRCASSRETGSAGPLAELAPAVETSQAPRVEVPPAVEQQPVAPAAPLPAWRRAAEVRIGLASDLAEVTLPCCDGEVDLDLDGDRLEVASPVTIRPAGVRPDRIEFRLQLGALRDEREAERLAARVRERTAVGPVEVTFDASTGLYRVRAGRFPDRERAREEGQRLSALGLEPPWVLGVPMAPGVAGLELRQRGRVRQVATRKVVLAAGPGGTLRFDGRRYRGTLHVLLNPRGTLNVVNVLPLEDYLRGVVPKELGPNLYPELEALKAQAVAARTYTLSHLGEFADEGFDLCSTPRCQVYGGADAEHPLSDRAVLETRSEVLTVGDQPVEAFYSATCGGHTEDVEVVFPLKRAPALVGVPCIESGSVRLHVPGPPARSVAEVVVREFEGAGLEPPSPEKVRRIVGEMARRVGLSVQPGRLTTLQAAELVTYLAQVFDLTPSAALFVRPEEVDYLLGSASGLLPESARRAAAYLVKSGIPLPEPSGRDLPLPELERLLFRLALWVGAVELRVGSFESLEGGQLRVRLGEETRSWPIGSALRLLRRRGEETRAGDLVLVSGDRLELYETADRLLAVVQEVHPQGAGFDREHPRSSWERFRSDEELRRLVRQRFPGFEFATFEVVHRGRSGRVGKIRLRSLAGEEEWVEGLAVRWVLDLPETWFTAERLQGAGRAPGWRFRGRGWGHGVGLCQVGAVGMARRGHDYRSILQHYYRGAQIVRLESLSD